MVAYPNRNFSYEIRADTGIPGLAQLLVGNTEDPGSQPPLQLPHPVSLLLMAAR